MLQPTQFEQNCLILDVPSSSTGRTLKRSIALRKAYGQRAKWTAAGHGGGCMQKLLARTLRQVANRTLCDSILKMGVHAAKR